MAVAGGTSWVRISAVLAVATAAISVTAFFSFSSFRRKSSCLVSRIRELEASLKSSIDKAAAERRGRVRAQQDLRKALTQQSLEESNSTSTNAYPMSPIGIVHSCFTTRNGTPRQPLLVPLARACLVFDPTRVPQEAFEGLVDYSHCWILYVFHLNTDLEKLWKEPSRSKFKAKVRVPRLRGGKMGVLATRSPHRPCPIGLTVAKVEAVDGHTILLSGVDLVDGTPVLDIKPYLPYSDSIQGAITPKWLEVDDTLVVASVNFSADFSVSLRDCWVREENQSFYRSMDEFKSLIKEVLSWDIRSLSQRNRPHHTGVEGEIRKEVRVEVDHSFQKSGTDVEASSASDITYHLILEGIDILYRVDDSSSIVVEKALRSHAKAEDRRGSNYLAWREKFLRQRD